MSARQLFRQEAVEFQRARHQWGDVAALQPLSSKILTWFLAAAVAALTVFACFAGYVRKETAIGYLTPSTGTAKIFAARNGVIREVHVKDGEVVQDGEPLLTIDTDQIASDGSDVNVSQLDTLSAQRQAISRNIESEETRAGSERDRLTALASGLKAEIAQLQAQLTLQSDRLEVANSDLDAGQQLQSKGYLTAIELRRRQMVVIDQRQSLSTIRQQISAKHNQLVETRSSLAQLPTLMAQKVQALRNDLAATEQRIAETQGRRAYVIRAPVAGRVSTLQATVGQNVNPQRLQLEIIPEGAALQAELFVTARAIGFVEAGLPVRLLYEAFPYQHFGTYRGRIVKVSQTILTSSDTGGPIKLNEPAYRVIASLERQDINVHGKTIPLQPDMLLRADIILEWRSLMDWLISPLLSVRM
ncbi:MAG: HlyD family efflux transporter periplasmic adaptor subunit [Xanthobacteraceae bacterium]